MDQSLQSVSVRVGAEEIDAAALVDSVGRVEEQQFSSSAQ